MSVILLLFGIHVIVSMRFSKAGSFNRDYISREESTAVKGVFTALVFMSHFSQYIEVGPYDQTYRVFQNHLNQMVVSMFWFYSGYGILESIRNKGRDYVVHFPVRRLLTVWIDYALAVCLYLVLWITDKRSLTPGRLFFSMIGWQNVGNSNWYMFATFVLYISVFFSFIGFRNTSDRKNLAAGLCLLTLFSVLFVYVEIKAGQPRYCYNTVILFSMGGWYSLLREKAEKLLFSSEVFYFGTVLLMTAVYLVSYQYRKRYGIEGYTVWAVSFTLLTVLYTMKCSIRSHLLEWLGMHVFGIYILQRIPMILLQRAGLMENHKYACFALSLAATLFLAIMFRIVTDRMNRGVVRLCERTSV
ncbi:MAG: acyltransferase family protein [Lachnospiraceae bacterium]|nr:acyltransferase family protein [Lachnospiraceae bacterium]